LPPTKWPMVGDRCSTDVLAGNRLGLFTVLVKPPLTPRANPGQRAGPLQTAELRLAPLDQHPPLDSRHAASLSRWERAPAAGLGVTQHRAANAVVIARLKWPTQPSDTVN